MRSSLRVIGPGLLVFALALATSGVLHSARVPGLPTTPLLTLLLVPLVRLLAFGSGAVTLGSLVVGLLLVRDARLQVLSRRFAIAYAASNAALAIVTLADVLARQWWGAIDATMLRSFLTQIDEGRYLTMQVLIGAGVAWLLPKARTGLNGLALTVAMAVAVALPGFTGHSTAALPHWVASTTMIVHLVAMSVWAGGVVAVWVSDSADAAARFSPLAATAYFTLVFSGIASVIARTADWGLLLHSSYGVVLACKILLTIGLGVVASRVRRAALARRDQAQPMSAVHRFVAVEAAILGMTLGLAVVLARMPNP